MTGRWTNQFQKDVAVEQRIFRGTYTVTNTTIEIGRPDIRQVQEHTFELFGHKNLKPRHLTSGLAVAAVGLTGYFLEKKFGLVSRVLGRGSVIFEVLYPASCSAEFEELVGKGVLENELKEMFNDLGKSLKELGLEDLIAELEDQDFERLTGIRLANFALCGQEIIDDLKKDGRSEGTTDIARSLGSSLEAIQNIEAIRRSDNGWVDINIEMQDTTDVVGYKVLIFPDKGKIREDYIKPDEPQKSDIITLKFLKKDLGYRFMVYLVYSDDTISMPLMTNHVAEQHQKQTAKHEAPVTPAKGQQGDVTGMIVKKRARAELKQRGGIDIVGENSDLAKYAMDIAVTPAKVQQGIVIGMVVEKGATAQLKQRGGIDIVGGDSDLAKYAMDIAGNRLQVTGNQVEVAVKFSDGSEKFVRKYKPDQTIYDVSAGIMKKKGQMIKHIVNTKTEKIEDEDTEISTLRDRGHLKSLRAVLE